MHSLGHNPIFFADIAPAYRHFHRFQRLVRALLIHGMVVAGSHASSRQDFNEQQEGGMNNFLRTGLAGIAAYKLGGGLISTILIFILIFWLLGKC